MAKVDYKTLYSKSSGKPLDKVKAVIKKHRARWDIEEFDEMIDEVLHSDSSTAEDVVDILALIVEQQGGNSEFKRAFFTLKAEVTKAHQRSAHSPQELDVPPVDDVIVDDE